MYIGTWLTLPWPVDRRILLKVHSQVDGQGAASECQIQRSSALHWRL